MSLTLTKTVVREVRNHIRTSVSKHLKRYVRRMRVSQFMADSWAIFLTDGEEPGWEEPKYNFEINQKGSEIELGFLTQNVEDYDTCEMYTFGQFPADRINEDIISQYVEWGFAIRFG